MKANQPKVAKLEEYLKALGKVENEEKTKSLCDHKNKKCDVRIKNGKMTLKKSWLSIVVNVTKIGMIALGMVVIATSAFFPFLTGTAGVLVISSLSLVANGLGLTKNIYGILAPKTEKEPVFTVAE